MPASPLCVALPSRLQAKPLTMLLEMRMFAEAVRFMEKLVANNNLSA